VYSCSCVAVFQTELNDERDEIDIDVMVQLLAPLLNSQHFLIEELKTAYRSITCENGFVFVFAEVCLVQLYFTSKEPFLFCLWHIFSLIIIAENFVQTLRAIFLHRAIFSCHLYGISLV